MGREIAQHWYDDGFDFLNPQIVESQMASVCLALLFGRVTVPAKYCFQRLY